MKMIRHIGIVIVTAALLVGIPFWRSDYFAKLTGRSAADTTSSASVIIDQPSGEYQVYINRAKHRDADNLNTWVDFFEGKEISFIFEDITCTVAKGDALGLEIAQSFQSRLPENQMTIVQTDATMMLSKADAGRYDIILLSREMAEAMSAQTVEEYEDTLGISGGGQ